MRSKMDEGWLNNNSKWMSSSVNQAFKELDYGRFSQTAYAKSQLCSKMSLQRNANFDRGDQWHGPPAHGHML